MFAKINQKRFCSFLAANVQQYNKYEIQISNDNIIKYYGNSTISRIDQKIKWIFHNWTRMWYKYSLKIYELYTSEFGKI